MNLKKKFLIATTALMSFAVPYSVYSATANNSTVINASIASVISMSSNATVAISITPTAGGSSSSASDTVLVSTNSTTGYNLVLKDSDTILSLTSGANTIANHSGTFSSPSGLTNNTWGYRVDGAGTFGAGPTSAQTNQPNLSGTWAGIKSSAVSGDTIKTTSTTATNDSTTVWYGVKADTTKPNGNYTNTVTYTATTN